MIHHTSGQIGDFITHKKGRWEGVIEDIHENKFDTSGGYITIRLSDGEEIELHKHEFELNYITKQKD